MVTLRVFTTRRLIRCTRFDGSCLRIFAAKCSTDKKLGSTDSHWVLSYRGKDPRKPKRFSWSVQGSLRGNRNPLRLFFFCQRFLLEKQKKMLCRSRKFAAVHQPIERLPSSSATAVIFTLAPLSQPPADSSPCRKGSRAAAVSYVFLKIYTLLINSAEDVL